MTTVKAQNRTLETLCHTVIEQQLGDLGELPPELVKCVNDVYREFMIGYLNMLRQKDKKSADWIPETVSIDTELTIQMSHFFSDYQHVTAEFHNLNFEIKRLLAMNPDSHQRLYQHSFDEILKRFGSQAVPKNTHEK